jgi:hypothetical protein
MSTEAQFKANQANAAHSTGPTSDAGRNASAQNHLIHGLFTRRDYVEPEERDIYKIFYETMFADLGPVTTLEQSYANEIAGASWRLRRCSAVEGKLGVCRNETDSSGRIESAAMHKATYFMI